MVHRWRCRHCSYTAWAGSKSATTDAVQSHIFAHHRSQIAREQTQFRWRCPYCDASGQNTDKERGIRSFKRHLFEHVEPLFESGVHVGDDVGGTGSVLVLAPPESDGADRARVHLHSPCDVVVFVTTNPARRLRLLDDHLQAWPAWTVVLTTTSDPFAGLEGIDVEHIPLEIVKLDKALSLQGLGQTISSVVAEQEKADGKLSVEFDVLSEIVQKSDVQTVFKFLHLLTSRLDDADALSQFYADPTAQSESTMNVLRELFDLTIDATGDAFTTV